MDRFGLNPNLSVAVYKNADYDFNHEPDIFIIGAYMKKGKDYIVFPLDFSSVKKAEHYVRILSGRVGMFKIGLELFIRQGPVVVEMIRDLSPVDIFLDLKLHDIPVTVKRAMERVVATNADFVTVHCSSSKKMLEMAVEGGQDKTGVLGVTLLTDNDSSVVRDAGFKEKYVANPDLLVLKRAEMAFDAGCRGIVCSGREAGMIKKRFGKDFLVVTPGIRPAFTKIENDDQQRIVTPAIAVRSGADFIVVGRPVRTAADPASAADAIAEEIENALDI